MGKRATPPHFSTAEYAEGAEKIQRSQRPQRFIIVDGGSFPISRLSTIKHKVHFLLSRLILLIPRLNTPIIV